MGDKKLILPIVIGLILVFFLIWYFGFYKKPAAPTSTGGAPTGAPAANSQSLGGQLYEKSKNPINDKLPETSPLPNPLEGVYKNPFAE